MHINNKNFQVIFVCQFSKVSFLNTYNRPKYGLLGSLAGLTMILKFKVSKPQITKLEAASYHYSMILLFQMQNQSYWQLDKNKIVLKLWNIVYFWQVLYLKAMKKKKENGREKETKQNKKNFSKNFSPLQVILT